MDIKRISGLVPPTWLDLFTGRGICATSGIINIQFLFVAYVLLTCHWLHWFWSYHGYKKDLWTGTADLVWCESFEWLVSNTIARQQNLKGCATVMLYALELNCSTAIVFVSKLENTCASMWRNTQSYLDTTFFVA